MAAAAAAASPPAPPSARTAAAARRTAFVAAVTAAAGAHAFYDITLDLGSEIPDRQVAALLVEHEMEGRRHGYLSLLYGFKWQGRVYKRWGGTGGAVEGRGGWEGRRGGCRGRPCWLCVCFMYGAHPLSGYHYPAVWA